MKDIIGVSRSIIPACDVDIVRFEKIVAETSDIEYVGAYKIGAALALSVGFPKVVEVARRYNKKPLIYDHQKAGTDIPETGEHLIQVLKDCGVDALIIFPLAGPKTQTTWINAAKEIGLPIISGGHMTHDAFLASEGGYIEDASIGKMFDISASHKIRDYVVPGNKPEVIKKIRSQLTSLGIQPVFYAPGFISQGGAISEAAQVAGPRWHAIIGRAIYEAADIRKATLALTTNLKTL